MKTLKLLVFGMLLSTCSLAQDFNLNFSKPIIGSKKGLFVALEFIGKKDNFLYTYQIQSLHPDVVFTFRKHNLNGDAIAECSYTIDSKNQTIKNLDVLLMEEKMLVSFEQQGQGFKKGKNSATYFAISYGNMKISKATETTESLFPGLPQNQEIVHAVLTNDGSKILLFTEDPNSSSLNMDAHLYDMAGQKLWSQTIRGNVPSKEVKIQKVQFEENGNILIHMWRFPIIKGELQESKANSTDLLFAIVNNGGSSFQTDLSFKETTYITDFTFKTDKVGDIVCAGYYRTAALSKKPSELYEFPELEAQGMFFRKFSGKKGEVIVDKKMALDEKNFNGGFSEKDWTTIKSEQAKGKWFGVQMEAIDLQFDDKNEPYFISRFNPKSLKTEKYARKVDLVIQHFTNEGSVDWSTNAFNECSDSDENKDRFHCYMSKNGLQILNTASMGNFQLADLKKRNRALLATTIVKGEEPVYKVLAECDILKAGFDLTNFCTIDEKSFYFLKYEEDVMDFRIGKIELK